MKAERLPTVILVEDERSFCLRWTLRTHLIVGVLVFMALAAVGIGCSTLGVTVQRYWEIAALLEDVHVQSDGRPTFAEMEETLRGNGFTNIDRAVDQEEFRGDKGVFVIVSGEKVLRTADMLTEGKLLVVSCGWCEPGHIFWGAESVVRPLSSRNGIAPTKMPLAASEPAP